MYEDKGVNYFVATNLFMLSNIASEAAAAAADGRVGDALNKLYDGLGYLAKAIVLAQASMEGIEKVHEDAQKLVELLYRDPTVTRTATEEPHIAGD